MKKILTKIFCIVLLILITLMSTMNSYYLNEVYAFELATLQFFSQNLLPTAAYHVNRQMDENGFYDQLADSVIETAKIIDNMQTMSQILFKSIPLKAKVRIAKLCTDMSNYDINRWLGTTFSNLEMTHIEQEMADLKLKIENNEPLTNKDMYDLGIHHIIANYMKNDSGNMQVNTDIEPIIMDGKSVYCFYTGNHQVRVSTVQGVNFDFYKFIDGNFKFRQNSIRYRAYSSGYDKLRFGSDYYYKLNLSSEYYLKITPATDGQDFVALSAGTGSSSSRVVTITHTTEISKLYSRMRIYNSNDEEIRNEELPSTMLQFLNFIKPYTSVDIENSMYYTNHEDFDVLRILLVPFIGNIDYKTLNTYVGNHSISGLGAEVWDTESVPDNNIGISEKIFENVTEDVTYDNDISVGVNQDTNEPEIIITPPLVDDIPTTTSSDVNTPEMPPESIDEEGNKTYFPFLNVLLDWIIKIWEMLKSIFDSITDFFSQSAESGGDPGTDWGNFKNFFDIFWIFYYLIIIAILLLVKFLAVVMNILSIPANTALFDSYPAILQGLNYVKGLKVGGFNVTIQQIFEYMFMVFFFIFIVTTIQKLYHVFTGVERQELRHNQRDIQIEKTSFSNEMPSNYELRETNDWNLYSNQKEGDKIRYYYVNKSASDGYLKNGGNKK